MISPKPATKNMNDMRKKMLFVILVTTTLLACNKDNDGPPKTETLTSGTWKLTAYTTDYNKDGTFEENTYAILGDCEKDNFYTFQAGGVLLKDEGPTMCIPSNPQTSTSTWSFQDNESSLIWAGSKKTIEELSSTTLKLKARVSYNVIFTIDVKTTYTKQ